MKDRRRYTVSLFGGLAAGLAHVSYLILFAVFHVKLMVYFNFVSVAVFTAVFFLFRREYYLFGLCVAILEFIAHQSLAVVSVGWSAGFQYAMIPILFAPFLILPTERIRHAIGLSILCGAAFLAMAYFLRPIEPTFIIPSIASRLMESLNLLILVFVPLLMAYLFVIYVKKAEYKAETEYERAENLLHNILPVPIAERLKAAPSAIADGFDCATVLFCDIVDFTQLSARLEPAQVVDFLNELFSRFDAVADRHGLEKIKTIGDAYMVASGIPERRDCNAHYMAEFALDILEEIRAFNKERGMDINMRIGMNSGPVVAGVIGKRKFIYDLWGDAVNMASRMESHGLAGKIQVTQDCYELLKEEYEFEERGLIEVKGKGLVRAWILNGKNGCLRPSPREAQVQA